MPHLVVIYGAPLTGKTTLAKAIAGGLDDKTALVSVDALLGDAIRVHDRDAFAELEMVHTQARLMVVNYLKNGYHVLLEGSFAIELEGVLHQREPEIDQTVSLMRNLAPSPLIVRLTATPDTLRRRADASTELRDVEAVLRIEAAYRRRHGPRSRLLSTDDRPAEELARDVLEMLLTERY